MKRIFAASMAVAFAFPIAGIAVAAEKSAAPAATRAAPAAEKVPATAPAAEKKAAPAAEKKAAPMPEKKAAKPTATLITGTIEAVDAASGTFTLKGKRGNVDLKAGEKVKLGDIKVGDKVVVKHADGSASSVKAVKAAKAKKAEPKSEAKPAVEKKAAPAPAAPPAAAPSTAPAKPVEKK